MNYGFDTVIIGAGPAGTGCGIVLHMNKQSVCVIDKAVFPRNKTCAGLVTGKTLDLIKKLFDSEEVNDLFCCTVSRIRLYRRNTLLSDAPIANGARLVNRIDFDNALVQKYKALGGEIMEGKRVIRIDYAKNRVLLSSGDTIGYRNLVFADGALSLSHKLVNVDRSKLAFGIEAYVPVDRFGNESVDLYFDWIDNGYLWVFPHGDTVCVGTANLYHKKTDYAKILSDFLRSHGVDPQKQRFIGAFLPYGYLVPQHKLPDNVILTGDAGGFTDPISGEGLYMALKTGMLAARALTSDSPKQTYLNSVKPLAAIVKDGKKVQDMFFSPMIQKVFLNKVKGKDKLVSYFYDNMVDEYRYEYRQIKRMLSDYKRG